MSFEEFIENIKEAVAERVEGTVEVKENVRNNNVKCQGLIVRREDCNISPAIKLDVFYKMYEIQGRTIDSLADEIVSIYNDSRVQGLVDMSVFTDWDTVKEHVMYRLVNYDKNKEQLQNAPYTKILDLAKAYYIVYSSDRHKAMMSVMISNEMMDAWDIDRAELEQYAEVNTPEQLPVVVERIEDVLGRLEDIEGIKDREELDEDFDSGIYLISNQTGSIGAGTILYRNVLKNLADELEVDELYIIPSSVHEVLVTGDLEDTDINVLRELVEHVNDTINEEDLLSGSIYCYEKEKDRIVLVAI